jgi:hypothetical protein
MHAFFRTSLVCLIIKNDTNRRKGMADTVCEYTLGLLCTISPCSFVPLFIFYVLSCSGIDQYDV